MPSLERVVYDAGVLGTFSSGISWIVVLVFIVSFPLSIVFVDLSQFSFRPVSFVVVFDGTHTCKRSDVW